MSLSEFQIHIIKRTVPLLKQHGTDVTSLFYRNVLEEHPELNNVFNQTNQVNHHQANALANSLYAYATHIDDLGVLDPAIEKICHKHASLYIQPEHYHVVGEGLLRAFALVLGSIFTSEIHDAWEAAYWQLANIMIGREKQLYSASEGWRDWREFVIANKIKESEEVTSFYLKPADGKRLPAFLPGQYLSVMTNVPQFGFLQSRQYSLSDAPHPDFYRISVKKESSLDAQASQAHHHPGWISNILHNEKPIGSTLQVSHPTGDFFCDPEHNSNKPIVLLSAGVGMTPLISILNTLVQQQERMVQAWGKDQRQASPNRKGSAQHISFIHAARTTAARAFHSHLTTLASKYPHINYTSYVKTLTPHDVVDRDYHHVGRLALPKLAHVQAKDLYLDDKGTTYFVCGPESFMKDVRRGLLDLGVEDGRIKVEVFGTGMLDS